MVKGGSAITAASLLTHCVEELATKVTTFREVRNGANQQGFKGRLSEGGENKVDIPGGGRFFPPRGKC